MPCDLHSFSLTLQREGQVEAGILTATTWLGEGPPAGRPEAVSNIGVCLLQHLGSTHCFTTSRQCFLEKLETISEARNVDRFIIHVRRTYSGIYIYPGTVAPRNHKSGFHNSELWNPN